MFVLYVIHDYSYILAAVVFNIPLIYRVILCFEVLCYI
jgi:hypothetical protein